MVRRAVRAVLVVMLCLGAVAPAAADPPLHEPAFLEPVPGKPCTPDNAYEASYADYAQIYPECERLKFAFGPILVKPGQNDVLLQPVTIEKPAYDGYIVRFKPDLVDPTGVAPAIEDVHLHHATWLNGGRSYGDGPFFASGEEKTIAHFPRGYGMRVQPQDVWLLLYMVHNATPQARVVYITYDIDFVKKADGDRHGIVPVRPVWLDVQKTRIHPDAPSTSGNPVFNVQKGFGHVDAETGKLVCRWPDENCARFDVYGEVTPQQGVPIDSIDGAEWRVRSGFEGTIVGLGGHLHPGGLRDEVSLIRNGEEKMIHISDAVYWDRDDPERAIAPTRQDLFNTWDFSMTVTGAPLGWKVKIKEGDVVRLNAVYDSEYSSWYENMGIVVMYVAPKEVEREDPYHYGPGLDVFDQDVAIDNGVPTTVTLNPQGWRPATCTPNSDPSAGALRLCTRGMVTHGHLAEASNFGGCPETGCRALPTGDGPLVSQISMAAFTYDLADMNLILQTGQIPRVRKGETVRFYNPDTAADIWHTVTRCAEPCTGTTGLAYPTADGGSGDPGDEMDFDSTEVGYGVFFSPASGQIGGGHGKSTQETIEDGAFWDFVPTRTGVYSFWCRIHPSMRGAIKVVE